MPPKHSLLYYQAYYFFHQAKQRILSMSENNGMPSPFPLEAAVNSTADLKNAELCAEETKPNTEKVITKAKTTDGEFNKLALSKGYIKKPKEKAMWEILMSIAWITWISMCIAFTLRYLSLATVTGYFIFSWFTFMPYLYEVGIGFTTVVLGQATKLLNQWYEQKQKGKEL